MDCDWLWSAQKHLFATRNTVECFDIYNSDSNKCVSDYCTVLTIQSKICCIAYAPLHNVLGHNVKLSPPTPNMLRFPDRSQTAEKFLFLPGKVVSCFGMNPLHLSWNISSLLRGCRLYLLTSYNLHCTCCFSFPYFLLYVKPSFSLIHT